MKHARPSRYVPSRVCAIVLFALLLALSCRSANAYLFKGFSSKGFSSKPRRGKGGRIGKTATKLLKQHGNDIDKASSAYFESKLQDMDDDLRERIGGAGGSREVVDEGYVRDAFVELKWNTVATFLPSAQVRSGEERSERRPSVHVDIHISFLTPLTST